MLCSMAEFAASLACRGVMWLQCIPSPCALRIIAEGLQPAPMELVLFVWQAAARQLITAAQIGRPGRRVVALSQQQPSRNDGAGGAGIWSLSREVVEHILALAAGPMCSWCRNGYHVRQPMKPRLVARRRRSLVAAEDAPAAAAAAAVAAAAAAAADAGGAAAHAGGAVAAAAPAVTAADAAAEAATAVAAHSCSDAMGGGASERRPRRTSAPLAEVQSTV